MDTAYGLLNGHLIGIAMKEMVRRAIEAIRAQRFMFEAKEKETPGKERDFVTSADTAAQQVYVKVIRECFPEFGIIAEENHLAVPCTHPTLKLNFSVDPVDGTKAFIRRQSHGIGTMLGLALNTEVIGAFVGDIMTHEIFGFRPNSDKVHRISEYGKAERLQVNSGLLLSEQYVLLRDAPDEYSPLVQSLVRPHKLGGLLKNLEVTGGSIGIHMARLWKSEVGATVLRGGYDTPWDNWPVIGISKKMGFAFLRPTGERCFERYEPVVSTDLQQRDHETLIIHESRLLELEAWMQK